LAGCASNQQDGTTDRNNTAIGAAVGAVAGAVIGGQLDDDGNRDRGVITGAVIGAAAGAGIGNVMDRQEQEMRDALKAEQARSEIEIQRVKDDLLKLTFDSEVTFDFDSASIKPSFSNSLAKVAEVMTRYQPNVQIVGHTDSTGDAAYNQRLSEQRASSVANYLIKDGVASYLISTSGAGESQPRESNATEAGRAMNRRVEMFVSGSK
jgi:outer membrane protein OmpA-like peptidoglycan-associated protein